MRTIVPSIFAFALARDASTKYTVARDQLNYEPGGDKQRVKDAAADARRSGAHPKSASVAGGGFESVMELTDLFRARTRRPAPLAPDAPVHGSFADFGETGYRGGLEGIEDDMREQLANDFVDRMGGDLKSEDHEGAVPKHKTDDHDDFDLEAIERRYGHKKVDRPLDEHDDFKFDDHPKRHSHNVLDDHDDFKLDNDDFKVDHPKRHQHKPEDFKIDDTEDAASENEQLHSHGVNNRKMKNHHTSTDHDGGSVWLESDKEDSRASLEDGTTEKSEDDPDTESKKVSGHHSKKTTHLDESELHDAIKYLYKMAGKIYDDPTVDKGYAFRILQEVPHVPSKKPWRWPFWVCVELPAGLLGGFLIGGGVPLTSIHGDKGGFYFGVAVILMLYAVGFYSILTKPRGDGHISPIETISSFFYTGKVKLDNSTFVSPFSFFSSQSKSPQAQI